MSEKVNLKIMKCPTCGASLKVANDNETIYTYFLIGSDNLPHITDTEEQGQFWLPEISETDYVASDEEYDRFPVTTVDPDDTFSFTTKI